MRLVFFLETALLLPPVLAGVIEARADLSATPFNAKEAAAATGILQTDILAGVAAITQQIYQATKQASQWKKCNPSNMVIRKEWYDLLWLAGLIATHAS
jgi:tyrosinase